MGRPNHPCLFGDPLYEPTAIAADFPLLLDLISQKRFRDRQDRCEPRAEKRRPKPYHRLTIPRSEAKKRIEGGGILYPRIKNRHILDRRKSMETNNTGYPGGIQVGPREIPATSVSGKTILSGSFLPIVSRAERMTHSELGI